MVVVVVVAVVVSHLYKIHSAAVVVALGTHTHAQTHTQLNANYAAVLQTAFTRGLGRPKTGIFVVVSRTIFFRIFVSCIFFCAVIAALLYLECSSLHCVSLFTFEFRAIVSIKWKFVNFLT